MIDNQKDFMKAALQKNHRHSTDLLIDDFEGFSNPQLRSGFRICTFYK